MSTSSRQTLMAIKASSASKTQHDKQLQDRQRDCLVLIMSHLRRYGYLDTVTALQREAGESLTRYECADNMDLLSMMRDLEDFYKMKFGRQPRFTRQSDVGSSASEAEIQRMDRKMNKARHAAMVKLRPSTQGVSGSPVKRRTTTRDNLPFVSSGVLTSAQKQLTINENIGGIRLVPERIASFQTDDEGENKENYAVKTMVTGIEYEYEDKLYGSSAAPDSRLLKPLPEFGGDVELRSLASGIQREILQQSPGVQWDDIMELGDAKRILKEAMIMPVKYPHIFTGILSPWRGILLYGPPGTGKTMLAKAVATQCDTTFFNISASSLVSKFRGDSEKLIKVMFDLARYHAPSTIFLDEIDSIMSHRGGTGHSSGDGAGAGEHEGSRRMKTELLIQMDGIVSNKEHHVLVLAASNMPWDLDQALLRRLEKRIFVPLPNAKARLSMLKSYLSSNECVLNLGTEKPESILLNVADRLEGQSGADIKSFCKEAAMRPVRRLLAKLEETEGTCKRPHKTTISDEILKGMMKRMLVISEDDLKGSLACTSSTAGNSDLHARYSKWTSDFGCT